MPTGDGEEAPVAQFLFDQEVVQVASGRALHDDLLLHQLVAHRPARRAFDNAAAGTRKVPLRTTMKVLRELPPSIATGASSMARQTSPAADRHCPVSI
jgi:hypothetical protein